MPENKFICIICGEEFYSKRSDARYCSNKCRQKAHRNDTKITVKQLLGSDMNTFRENVSQQLEDFISRNDFPLRESVMRENFTPDKDMFLLCSKLGIEKEFYRAEYESIDTVEIRKRYVSEIKRLKATIIDKWRNGTYAEKEEIFIYYFRWGTSGEDLANLYHLLYPET